MFERFTDRARRVIVLAQEEAGGLGHDYIGTEHLLLGLITEGTAVAARALEALGVTAEAVRLRVEKIAEPGAPGPVRERFPFRPQAKKTLELSLREAIQLGHNYIGPEHILLGLVRLDDHAAMEVLNHLGAEPNRVRQHVIQLIVAGRPGNHPETGRHPAGRGKRKLGPELLDRIDSIEWRLSALEYRVGTGPDMSRLDQEIAEIRRERESAVDAQDYEHAAVLRDRERQLLGDWEARQQEWAMLPSLSDEVERLRDLLRRHGIDPQDGAA